MSLIAPGQVWLVGADILTLIQAPIDRMLAAAAQAGDRVVDMGRDAAAGAAQALMRAGRDRATPVLVALDASLPTERIAAARLETLALTMLALPRGAPTTLMIGRALLAATARREDASLVCA